MTNIQNRFYGIRFPFKNSNQGFYFDLTKTSKDAVRSNLLHLLITKKGSRLYRPDFGTNLMDFIFEPMDQKSFEVIQSEITNAVQKNINGINIDEITITPEDKTLNIEVKYSYNEGYFVVKDIVSITI